MSYYCTHSFSNEDSFKHLTLWCSWQHIPYQGIIVPCNTAFSQAYYHYFEAAEGKSNKNKRWHASIRILKNDTNNLIKTVSHESATWDWLLLSRKFKLFRWSIQSRARHKSVLVVTETEHSQKTLRTTGNHSQTFKCKLWHLCLQIKNQLPPYTMDEDGFVFHSYM